VNRQERRRQRKQQQKSSESQSGISPNVTTADQLDNASELYSTGKLDEAAELCLDAIAGAPLESEPYHLLALVRYRQGRLQDAGENILEAITRNDDNPEIHANCGAIMNMLGRYPEAEAACRHVIHLQPRNAESHSNLAVALEMQGRIDEAKAACKKALRLNPDYPEAMINLGNLHVRSGDYISGVEVYAKAIQQVPNNPTARANLSVALLRLGQIDEALNQAQGALNLSPDYVEALNAQGNALSANGEFERAQAAFNKAHTIQPAHREAGLNLAAVQHKSGHSDEAISTYQDILTTNPDRAEAQNGMGVVLLAQGKCDAAIAAFRRAIEITPSQADAYYNLASSGTPLSEDEIESITTLLHAPSTHLQQKISLHFALADLADQKADTDTAIAQLNAGNGLRKDLFERNEIGFDGDDLDRKISKVIDVFSPEVLARLKQYGDPSQMPVFICGMPRSGTTLIEQIVSSHERVSSVGELGVIGDLLDGYPDSVPNLDAARIAELSQHVLDKLAPKADKIQRTIDKSPFNFFHLGLIQILFPNARIIHCQRDPMDVGLSCYAQNFVSDHPWSTDLTDIARYIGVEDRMMKHWRSTLSLPTLDVQYEDVIADQDRESRRMIEFLGLEWDDACLRFYENDQTVLTASNWQVRRPIYTTSLGKARAYGDHLRELKEALAK